MGLFSHIKGAMDNEPSGYQVAGRQVVCSHCGGASFEEGAAMLNTAGLTFLDLDWLDQNASILKCTNCGHIEWFVL